LYPSETKKRKINWIANFNPCFAGVFYCNALQAAILDRGGWLYICTEKLSETGVAKKFLPFLFDE
jgi:hypothetical protein